MICTYTKVYGGRWKYTGDSHNLVTIWGLDLSGSHQWLPADLCGIEVTAALCRLSELCCRQALKRGILGEKGELRTLWRMPIDTT